MRPSSRFARQLQRIDRGGEGERQERPASASTARGRRPHRRGGAQAARWTARAADRSRRRVHAGRTGCAASHDGLQAGNESDTAGARVGEVLRSRSASRASTPGGWRHTAPGRRRAFRRRDQLGRARIAGSTARPLGTATSAATPSSVRTPTLIMWLHALSPLSIGCFKSIGKSERQDGLRGLRCWSDGTRPSRPVPSSTMLAGSGTSGRDDDSRSVTLTSKRKYQESPAARPVNTRYPATYPGLEEGTIRVPERGRCRSCLESALPFQNTLNWSYGAPIGGAVFASQKSTT